AIEAYVVACLTCFDAACGADDAASSTARDTGGGDVGVLLSSRIVLSSDLTASNISQSTRQSMLAMPSKSGRCAGVEMDMATKLANEMWQKGKEALETAGNIKKECRATAIECLQTLYETTLALSDSRSRHKYNLERESKRHAQELIRVERAYNRTITDLTTKLASAIESQHKKAEETFQLTKNIDDWLRFETREPQEKIGEICTRISTIGNSLRNIETTLDNMQKAPVSSMPDTSTDIILAKIQTLQMVIDTLRKDIQNNLTHLEQTQKNFSNTQETATNTQLLVGQIWERLDSNITSPNNELVSETKALRDDMSQITELLEVGTAGKGEYFLPNKKIMNTPLILLFLSPTTKES
ncbi:hypothetical protein ACJJTC_018433, partial [Scirpophaga incertulas]